jgi:hypothetical protein
MLFVILGVPVGAFLALHRYPVFSLAPVVALFAAGAIVTGIVTGHDPRIIGIEGLGRCIPATRICSRQSHALSHSLLKVAANSASNDRARARHGI